MLICIKIRRTALNCCENIFYFFKIYFAESKKCFIFVSDKETNVLQTTFPTLRWGSKTIETGFIMVDTTNFPIIILTDESYGHERVSTFNYNVDTGLMTMISSDTLGTDIGNVMLRQNMDASELTSLLEESYNDEIAEYLFV